MVDLQQIPRSRTTKPAGSTVSIEFSPARPAELGSPLVSTPRSLVTGGAGFLGSHLCDRLLLEGHEVICVDNLLTGRLENVRHLLAHPRFTFVRHDVSAPIELESLVPNAGGNGWRGNGARPRLDHVLHFASPASPKDYASHPIETLKCGAFGTYNALTLARETKSVFLLASTSEVYGDPEVSPQPESYWGRVNPMGPRSCYDEAKRYAEAMTFAFHRKHGVKVRVIRIFNTYGERMRLDDGRVLPNFLGQALRGEPLTVYGDGSQTRSFCYVSDLVEGIYRMLLSHETGPINLGNPEEIPVVDMAREVIRLTGSQSVLRFEDLPVDDPQLRKPDISKAISALGWHPRVDRLVGIERVIPYFQAMVDAPAARANGHAPTTGTNGHAPAAESNGHVPAQGTNGHAPAAEVNGHAPAAEVNGHAPAAEANGHAPAAEANGHAPATEINGQSSPVGANGHAPAEVNGVHAKQAVEIAPAPRVRPRLDAPRPVVRGKFLFQGDDKLYLRGVTYGTFRPRADGAQFPKREILETDIAEMAARGINSIRTYTVPPAELLDFARQHGMHVLVGLPWEAHLTFLDDRRLPARIVESVRAGVRACGRHPSVLGFALGNEIPSTIVRWYGRTRIERFLRRLRDVVKQEDPGALVTYVNFPTTEYLRLPFLDFVSFNVYLESEESLAAYLARLQNLADDRPLLLAECGLDSRRHGEGGQAESLDRQVRTAFDAGCAGVFVYAWTDEWFRGGSEILDWDFGLTRRDRSPKPALAAVERVLSEAAGPVTPAWPKISVLVCTYNGGHVIEGCFQALQKLDYPDFEVIVVSDGSTDNTVALARSYGFRVIAQENQGLSAARNRALREAQGEIVAYIDDDAFPDPHWLRYLAHAFMTTEHAGVGGPNIPPLDDPWVADCVAHSPGGPNVVLTSDTVAEHIPGCNMAFRKSCLEAIGGFDTQFRIAGDDVDLCWRLEQRGWTLGYSPAAVVWHRRRASVKAYWRQQRNYGRAEAMLERKWPEKYNALGHARWQGRVYGPGQTLGLLGLPQRVYHGLWGSAPFQRVYDSPLNQYESLLLIPEWYLSTAALVGLAALGIAWRPLLWALPLAGLSLGIALVQGALSAARAMSTSVSASRRAGPRRALLIASLHLLQPMARLSGRIGMGLSPWRLHAPAGVAVPRGRSASYWSGRWLGSSERLAALQAFLLERAASIVLPGESAGWDLEVRGGFLGSARLLMAIEEHGANGQRVLLRLRPRVSRLAVALTLGFTLLAVPAARDRSWLAAACLGGIALLLALRTALECAAAVAAAATAMRHAAEEER